MKNSHQATPSHKRPSKAKKNSGSGHAVNGRSDTTQLDADARHLAQQQPRPTRDQEMPAEDSVERSDTIENSVERENADSGSIERDSTHDVPVAKGRHAQRRSASSTPSKRAASETADD